MGLEPVAPGINVDDMVLRLAFIPADPAAHHVEVFLKHREVAGADIDFPRHDRCGVRPAGAAAGVSENAGHVRDNAGNGAVRILVEAHAFQPACEEGIHIGVEDRGGGESLRITRPAEAFVALRAVGGDIEEISAQAPDDVALELVEHFVGRGESPALCEIRVKHGTGDP